MSTVLILVVLGSLIVLMTRLVTTDPDQPATERRHARRGRRRRRPLPRTTPAVATVTSSRPATVPATVPTAPVPSAPAAVVEGRAAERLPRGERYVPPPLWRRLRSALTLLALTTLVGATLAAVVGVSLVLLGIVLERAVN